MTQEKRIPIYDLETDYDINIQPISHSNTYDFNKIHRHSYYEILFFNKGGGYQLIDFKKVPILNYSCYIIKPRQVHLVKRESSADGLLIQFTDNTLLTDVLKKSLFILQRYNETSTIFQNNEKLITSFLLFLHQLKTLQKEKSLFYKQKTVHVLATFLFTLEECLLENYESVPIFKDTNIFNFMKLVESNLNKFSVNEYAQKLNVSPKKLTEIVKKQLGITPLKYIHNFLLLEIKRDLAFKELNLKEIAYRYNFDSPSNFSLFIKKHTQLTPSELQKQLLNQ